MERRERCPAAAHDPLNHPPRPGGGAGDDRGNSFANGPDGMFKQMREQMRMIQAFQVNRFALMESPLPF